MNKFELAERLVNVIDGNYSSDDMENLTLLRANLEECDGSIEIVVGNKKFTLNIREI